MKTFLVLFLSIFLAIPVSAQRFGKVVGNTNELMAQPVPDIHTLTIMKGLASSNENLFLPFQYIRGSTITPNGQTVFQPTFGSGTGRYHLLSWAFQSGTNITLIYTNITTIVSSNLTFITTNVTFIATNTTNFGITYIDASTTNFITFNQLFATTNHVAGAPSTDTAIARWDGTTGLLLQNSDSTMADTTGAIRVTGDSAGGSVLYSAPSGASNSDWRWGHGMGTFLAVNDPFMGIGYNTKFTGGGFGQSNPLDSAAYYAIEANYRVDLGNGFGPTNYMEMYAEMLGTNGNSTRPFMSQSLKSDPEQWTSVLSHIAGTNSQWTVNDHTSGTDVNIFTLFKNGYGAYFAGTIGINTLNINQYQIYGSNGVVGIPNTWRLEHGATSGALSDAKLLILTPSGGGDPFINFVAGSTEYSLGIDNSVSGDPWKLSGSSALGTTDLLTVPTTGDATLLSSLTISGNPFGHLLLGAPSGVANTSWRLAHYTASFLGVDDPTLFFGYNVGDDSARTNLLEPSVFTAMESNYRADVGLGPTNHLEWYVSMAGTNGNSIRPFATIANRSNPHTYTSSSVGIAGASGAFNIIDETNGVIFSLFRTAGVAQLNGYFSINTPNTFLNRFYSYEAVANTPNTLRVEHAATSGATSHAKALLITGAGGGDPFINFVSGSQEFSLGVDNSASDVFKIAASGDLGTTDLFTMTPTGVITLANDLDVTEGGTGVSTFTDGGVLIGNASGDIQATSAGVAGTVLTSNGAGVDPTFQAAAVTGAGGSTTQVQYNNAGALAGDAGFTYSAANDAITVVGNITNSALSASALVASDANKALKSVAIGSNLSYDGTTLSATGGGAGSVTSVALTMPSPFSVAGSPVTTTGTLAVGAVDPGADRLIGFDDGNGDIRYITIGSGLNYDQASDTLTSTAVGTGGGDVVGPASATDNAVARYDGATGKLIQNSSVILDDVGWMSGVTNLTVVTRITNSVLTANTLVSADANKALKSVAIGANLTFDGTTLAAAGAGTGDVVGPGSATDNALARFDTGTGKLIQNSVAILADTGELSGVAALAVTGGITNAALTANKMVVTDANSRLTSLPDPNFNAVIVYDNTDNIVTNAVIGTGLSYDPTSNTLSATNSSAIIETAFITKTLTDEVNNSIFELDLPSNTMVNAQVWINIEITGTATGNPHFQTATGFYFITGANNAGTILSTSGAFQAYGAVQTAGSFSLFTDSLDGASKITFRLEPDTSLLTPTITLKYRVVSTRTVTPL